MAATALVAACTGTEDGREPDQILDSFAKPALTWSVPPRYDASWGYWNSSTARYDPGYASPTSWSVNLDACASTSPSRIDRYLFEVSAVGFTWHRKYDGPACRRTIDGLPQQGLYRVNLVLDTKVGLSKPLNQLLGPKDYLVVVIGDSLASGEGVPDSPGDYEVDYGSGGLGEAESTQTHREVRWMDRRCHRSAKSGPALAAKALEDASPYTSVTFLSFACSGAALRHLVDTGYIGWEPVGDDALPPQIDAVAAATGASEAGGGRRIDALIVAAGANDLGFGDIVKRCAKNNNNSPAAPAGECVTSGGIATQLNGLRTSFDSLAGALTKRLPEIREVYLSRYPSEVFAGGGCGTLGRPGFGITATEADLMSYYGNLLNRRIAEAAGKNAESAHWNVIDDLSLPFGPHAYCSDEPWFRSYEQSWETQGNEGGTAHPNERGHRAYAGILRKAIVPEQGATRYRHLTVVVESVKARKAARGDLSLEMQLFEDQTGSVQTRQLTVPRNGEWTEIPSALGTFTLDVFIAPASPRHAIGLGVAVGHTLSFVHTKADEYGAGHHELTHPTGNLAIQYRVTATSPACQGGDCKK
jgi:hypothetical protein